MADVPDNESDEDSEDARELTKENIPLLLKRLDEKSIIFVENKANIRTVQREKASSEYRLLAQFVPKGWRSILVQMGLALREISSDPGRVANLRELILQRYGESGLHAAELTEIGVITQLLAHLTKIYSSPPDVQRRLTLFFDQIDDLTLFIRKSDAYGSASVAARIKLRLETNSAHMMIVFGSGSARGVTLRILKLVASDKRNYAVETQDDGKQITAYIFTPEVRAKLAHWSELIRDKT